MAEALITAEGLRREWAGVPVLAGVDLAVAAGDVIALLGANGAGKSTLLRVLATLLRPSGGRLVLFGTDARGRPAAVRRRLGWLGHESACYPDLSARENLAFHAALYGLPDAAGRIDELLDWAGLTASARRPVRVYSRGMSQRLALARALLHRPDVLLLDEPYTGLDAAGAVTLDGLLADARRDGRAVVLSTHDLARVAALATRVVILHRGRVAWTRAGSVDAQTLATAYADVTAGRSA